MNKETKEEWIKIRKEWEILNKMAQKLLNFSAVVSDENKKYLKHLQDEIKYLGRINN